MVKSAHDLEPYTEMSPEALKRSLKTAPNDVRTPETNQAKHCYFKYNEFFRCEKFKGEGAPACKVLKSHYTSLCPSEWVERWDEQREAGIFPGPL
eukprot:CAMPEP_0173384996 /NCGR_PEP_ID=MMETSP1356-20130122/7573_1 /TAXON_ID=77927 ORGANISM="Hemiselmis virescens, Strain PCC157" /NCGR_SAMPLE_ID=MMETSP1356 /ASSEMBLY_ACC=CAM_ASM_000847 /LENGTH=94 /DNA_ID=CAMNT_0014340603 /DNA_START=79 /DNA_END=363 /DNA_ORIENTATION=+